MDKVLSGERGDVRTAISDGLVGLLKQFYGRGPAVLQQRMDFQELMRERFEHLIEDATGRKVIGCINGNQQDPDLMCEIFILAPTKAIEHRAISGAATL